MQQIDHDPEEPKIDRGPGPWRSALVVIALLWAGYLYSFVPDWTAIALGVGTGGVLVAWAIEITGNKVPASWRTKPPRSGGS